MKIEKNGKELYRLKKGDTRIVFNGKDKELQLFFDNCNSFIFAWNRLYFYNFEKREDELWQRYNRDVFLWLNEMK